MTDHENIASALSAFQAEMPVVGKNKIANVPMKAGGSYKYAYADLADIVTAVSPALAKHGLAFTCSPTRTDTTLTLAGTLTHTSGDTLTGELPIFGRTPQEIGSSLTYARRYLIGCLTGVVTDDDDDAQAANTAREAATRDWSPIIDSLAMVTVEDDLRAMWHEEKIPGAPQYVRDAFTAALHRIQAAASGGRVDKTGGSGD